MNAGKIIRSAGSSVELKQTAGLFDCLLKHKVVETTATFDWKGPKITKETWDQILAYFDWTQQMHKSEAQLRLFVHPEHGWLAWAFPQKGGTGMSSSEIDNEDAKKQRAEFIPAGYLAFGTVHHHCECGAFQSGTDERDESPVDGLHITVGDMNKERYSLDCRLYLKGNKFEPDLAAFYDIGLEHEPHLEWMASVGYEVGSARSHIAKMAMSTPAPRDTPFPALWKENYILPPPMPVHAYQLSHGGYNGQGFGPGKTTGVVSTEVGSVNGLVEQETREAAGKVLEELAEWAEENKYTLKEVVEVIEDMGKCIDNDLRAEIFGRLYFENLNMDDLVDELRRRERAIKEEMTTDKPQGLIAGWDGYGD